MSVSSQAMGLRPLHAGRADASLLPMTAIDSGLIVDQTAPLDVVYDLAAVDIALFEQPPLPGIERWQPLLPMLKPGFGLGEGGTPLLPMGRTDGGSAILIKDESRNPTFSHKDRLNLVTANAAIHAGAPGIVAASSGNHGVSAAAYAARAGLPCTIVVGDEIAPTFLRMLRAYAAEVVTVPVDERWPTMRRLVETRGYHPVSNLTVPHTGHPWGVEGYKTIAYELFLQLGRRAPGAILIPTGYGELLYGIHKGFGELTALGLIGKVPSLFSVEPFARGPLHAAVTQDRSFAVVAPRPTRQLSIACTVGGYRARLALRESGGRALVVDDAAALAAQRRLRDAGLWQELSGAAGLAALDQLTRSETEGDVVVLATSAGFKDPDDDTIPSSDSRA